MFTTTYADPIMKEVILPGVREYMNTATVVLKYAERETQASPTGEFIVTHNREMNNNAGSGRPEDGVDLPEARPSKYARSTVPTQLLYTRAKWTGKVIAATKSKDSLINALVEETKRAVTKSKSSANRQLTGDGRDALAFYVSGAGASSGVVAGEFSAIEGYESADRLAPGDTYVDLIDVSDGGYEQSLVIRRGAVGASGVLLRRGHTGRPGPDRRGGRGSVVGSGGRACDGGARSARRHPCQCRLPAASDRCPDPTGTRRGTC